MMISIAMAVYNGEKYITQQLESFALQDKLPDELIICDDCSSDGSVQIIEDYAKSLPFKVKIFKNRTNLGYCKNFEKAISLCTGDLILLSDQDDYWFRDKISTLLEWMLAKPDVLVAQSNMEITDSDLSPSGITQLDNFINLGYQHIDFMTGCGLVFRRKLFEVAFPFPDSGWGHDNWLFSLALYIGKTDLYQRPLMYYRRHQDNASSHFASSGKKLSKWDALKQSGLSNATVGWENEIQRCEDIYDRIISNKQLLISPGNHPSVDQNLDKLKKRILALRFRVSVVKIPRWRRFISAFMFWIRDGYNEFRGWRSFIKDCIRP